MSTTRSWPTTSSAGMRVQCLPTAPITPKPARRFTITRDQAAADARPTSTSATCRQSWQCSTARDCPPPGAAVETTFRNAEAAHGLGVIRYRGLIKANAQVLIAAITFNMCRWVTLRSPDRGRTAPRNTPKPTQTSTKNLAKQRPGSKARLTITQPRRHRDANGPPLRERIVSPCEPQASGWAHLARDLPGSSPIATYPSPACHAYRFASWGRHPLPQRERTGAIHPKNPRKNLPEFRSGVYRPAAPPCLWSQTSGEPR